MDGHADILGGGWIAVGETDPHAACSGKARPGAASFLSTTEHQRPDGLLWRYCGMGSRRTSLGRW